MPPLLHIRLRPVSLKPIAHPSCLVRPPFPSQCYRLARPQLSKRPPPTPLNQRRLISILARAGSRPLNRTLRRQAQRHASSLFGSAVRKGTKDFLRLTIYFWAAVGSLYAGKFGIDTAFLEHTQAAPAEWSWVSQYYFRHAKQNEAQTSEAGSGGVDWANTGNYYRRLIERLENPSIDGRDLTNALGPDEVIYVAGIGKTGLDISHKSSAWRQGYFEALKGAARAAEQLDGWVRDRTRQVAFPKDVVIGPSNPRPRPVPAGAVAPPKEEDCEPAFEDPETCYMRMMTTVGFSTRQRLDAALGLADWLHFKGLGESSNAMYDWALDIALDAMDSQGRSSIDSTTGIIKAQGSRLTSNALLAISAIAVHRAQTGDLAAALPAFLSLLRAQQRLPPPIPSLPAEPSQQGQRTSKGILGSFQWLFTPIPFDVPGTTGDEPATRTPSSICSEAATMAHIGEILYASDSPGTRSSEKSGLSSRHHKTGLLWATPVDSVSSLQEEKGLAWTRDAVELAEQTLRACQSSQSAESITGASTPAGATFNGQHLSAHESANARRRCIECLETTLENWQLMVGQLASAERAEARARTLAAHAEQSGSTVPASAKPSAGSGWFWRRKGDDHRSTSDTNQTGFNAAANGVTTSTIPGPAAARSPAQDSMGAGPPPSASPLFGAAPSSRSRDLPQAGRDRTSPDGAVGNARAGPGRWTTELEQVRKRAESIRPMLRMEQLDMT